VRVIAVPLARQRLYDACPIRLSGVRQSYNLIFDLTKP
jgi:hypothetical protein